MTHEIILNMIENVDPEDTNTLNEIDARYWCWSNDKEYLSHTPATVSFKTKKAIIYSGGLREFKRSNTYKEYTRSRDALKAIRPEAYFFRIIQHTGNGLFGAVLENKDGLFFTCPLLSTEELAELHAIIQAKAYEKEN